MSASPRPMAAADTIYALSSGLPPAAVAVMRVSGPMTGEALVRLCGALPPPRRATLKSLRDPADGSLLDKALLLWFPAPASATGEDLAELHLHGSRAVVAAVGTVLAAMPGMRAAEAGEFTRRAFINGRLDLAAVEGLSDLLVAETEAQRRAALAASGGLLGREIEGWRLRTLDLAAAVEATLDFADEADVTIDRQRMAEAIMALAQDMTAALARPSAERLRDGLRVVIAGPPNAGKSSLLNALVGREAAITSPHAGTTRDRIEAPVSLAGLPFLLIDTAGLRDAVDVVEAEGVERAAAAVEDADILLWLDDDAAPVTAGVVVRVHARADLPARALTPAGMDITLSVRSGRGLDALTDRLIEIGRGLLPREGEASLNTRQRSLVMQAQEAVFGTVVQRDDLLVAEGLREAMAALDRITGRAGVENMLDRLFAGFCIGK